MSPSAARPTHLVEPTEEETEHLTRDPLIAVVGPCGAGKSALVRALRARGFRAREAAQEHSFAPSMWQRIINPDLLIYLDVSRETAQRRVPQQFPARWWAEAEERLAHARAHADLFIDTDALGVEEVCEKALAFLAGY